MHVSVPQLFKWLPSFHGTVDRFFLVPTTYEWLPHPDFLPPVNPGVHKRDSAWGHLNLRESDDISRAITRKGDKNPPGKPVSRRFEGDAPEATFPPL